VGLLRVLAGTRSTAARPGVFVFTACPTSRTLRTRTEATIHLETTADEFECRIIDLWRRSARASGPDRRPAAHGQTVLLKKMTKAIRKNYQDVRSSCAGGRAARGR